MYGTAPPLTPVSNLPRGHSNGLIPTNDVWQNPILNDRAKQALNPQHTEDNDSICDRNKCNSSTRS